MKNSIKVFLILIVLFFYSCNTNQTDSDKETSISVKNNNDELELESESEIKYSQIYFSAWHYPDGYLFPIEKLNKIWQEIDAMPDESDIRQSVNSWTLIGPDFMKVSGDTSRYTGRVLDIESDAGSPFRVATVGGLWETAGSDNICLTNNLKSLVVSSVDTKPGDSGTIIIGTGQYQHLNGIGAFLTTNSGGSWRKLSLTPDPIAVMKVRYEPGNSNNIHLAASTGYYKSTNGGTNWIRTLDSVVSDFQFNPSNPSHIFAGVWRSGIHVSTNGGVNWTKLTTGGIPTTNVGRSNISICTSNPNIIYIGISKEDATTLGAYKTTNMGTNWSKLPIDSNYLGTQGGFGNMMSVSPVNPDYVFAGGINLYSSTNGGNNWRMIGEPNVHVDHHASYWSSDGLKFISGNDGGLAVTTNMGLTWSYSINVLPITQYYGIDAGVSNTNIFSGASQDNGISVTTNGGNNWLHTQGGDGTCVAINPFNTNILYATVDSKSYIRSTNGGTNWNSIHAGIVPNTGFAKIRTDLANPSNIYANSLGFVYISSNNGTNWTQMNPVAFPEQVANINISKFSPDTVVIYASLNPTTQPYTGKLLRIYSAGVWSERSAGLDSAVTVRGVRPHPRDSGIAYAYMNGMSEGKKVYKTTNTGISWINISGNLPNVPMGDIIPHPSNHNILYAGSEMGCYKTTDGGEHWFVWNFGMPVANVINEFAIIDSIAQNGRYYIVAGSYGRSIWIREISGDDPVAINNNSNELPMSYSLRQNYPNPFNPSTQISFDLPKNGFVTLKVYDITGKEIAQLVNSDLNAGSYKVNFNAMTLSSGIYLYRISADNFTDTKKMVFVK